MLALSTTLALLGLNPGVARYISRFEHISDVRGAWLTGLGLSLAVAAIFVFTLLSSGSTTIGLLFESPESRFLLTLFVLAIPFNVGFRLATGAIRGLENTIYRTYARDLFYNGFRLVLVGVLLSVGFGVVGVGYAYLIAGIATVVVIHLLLNRLLRLRGELTLHPRRLLLFSIPLVLSAMVSKILGEMDTLMLGYFTDTTTVGLYDPAYQLASGLPVILSSFGFLYMPLTSRLDSEDSHDEIKRIYKVTTKWVFIAGFPLFLLFVSFPTDIVSSVFGEAYAGGSEALWLIATGFFVSAAYGRAQDTLAAFGYTRVILGINTAAAVLNIVLNVVLIPRYGLVGAATATAVSFITLNGFAFAILWYVCDITPFSRWSVRTFIVLPGTLLPAMVVVSQVVTLTPLSLPVFAALDAVLTVAVAR
ncbi:flippase [Halococcus sp. IIIV-5B]|uniref:flippase n=1 Tax=Halococcus sp. IIIV-5B TaxID=2321230 RepID=UPI001F321371|nr:flippase [Halococcus sp. IIIV-5B]